MSNVKYGDKIYNEEVKNRFLSNYKKNTQNTLLRLFKASYKSENDLKKDLYDFNREQIRSFLFLLRPANVNASRQNGNQLSIYIDWAIQEGLRKGTNPLSAVPKEWFEQFVDKTEMQYFTDARINEIIKGCENYQDKVIIKLLMEGVGGEGHAEILNLRKNDINAEENTLHLTDDDGNSRTLQVSPECVDLCLRALNETEYRKRNGQTSPDIKSDTTNLISNDYVLKSSITNTENTGRADKHLIYRRISVISKVMEEPNLDPKSISYSGMIAMARDLLIQEGELGKEQLNKIAERFKLPKSKSGEYSLHRYKDEFLNVEKIKEIYPEAFE